MKIKEFYLEYTALLNHFQSLSLLAVRVILAYGFYEPALLKWSNMETTVEWFSSLGFPLPYFMAVVTASVEIIGVVLLLLGFFTRYISMPLLVIMLVAIFFVHFSHGFLAVNDGFEIPLYYFFFLSLLVTHGAGRFSIDYFIFKGEK